MRILFLATYFPSPVHPSRGNWALEQALAFRAAGHEVEVVVPTPWVPKVIGRLHAGLGRAADVPREWRPDGLVVHYPRWFYYPWAAMAVFNRLFPEPMLRLAAGTVRGAMDRIADRFHPDVICCHHSRVSGYVAYRYTGTRDSGEVPYIVIDHEVGDFLECGQSSQYARLMAKVTRNATACITVSDSMGNLAREALPLSVFQTIYNGSSFPVYVRDCGTAPAVPVVVFCCSKFYGRKDIPLLLAAFDELAGDFPDAVLRIAGDGPDAGLLKQCHESMTYRERVTFLGLLDPVGVRKEMEQADVFALVGWAEPFGVVFLEAMACGLPVIVSADSGVAEVLVDGESAQLTQPRDRDSVVVALRALLSDPGLRRRMGKAGQEIFRSRFQWSSIVQEYEEVFERCRAVSGPFPR